jgi:hypothetical protein
MEGLHSNRNGFLPGVIMKDFQHPEVIAAFLIAAFQSRISSIPKHFL